jgi:anaerobic selenocysteine-containing dehydrogenase
MTDTASSRRDFLKTAAAGVVTVSAIAAATTGAEAYQGNMERALSALYDALASLRESTPNKGGHRETAIQLVQQAIAETQAGIQFAEQHGGG